MQRKILRHLAPWLAAFLTMLPYTRKKCRWVDRLIIVMDRRIEKGDEI